MKGDKYRYVWRRNKCIGYSFQKKLISMIIFFCRLYPLPNHDRERVRPDCGGNTHTRAHQEEIRQFQVGQVYNKGSFTLRDETM